MSLYKITADKMEAVARTTFAAEQILERNDIQRMLIEDISPVGDDLMVIAEEYGDFEGVNRRIDLLCLNSLGDLVVVEIKRTEDGGHMDLQALRYAAMVSSMSLEQAVQTYARFRHGGDEDEARGKILDFLQSDSDEDAALTGEVRIVLVSADFSSEIATAVLWLNKRDLDITCIRLRPYKVGNEVLVEATQIIPLPEAADYEVKLRTQEQEKKRASGRAQGELTKFWMHMIHRRKDDFPFLSGRPAPKNNKFVFNRCGGYELRLDALKDRSYFTAEIQLPEEGSLRTAILELLAESRDAIESKFGDSLDWEESRAAYSIFKAVPGGWASPESEWPEIQDQTIERLLCLEAAILSTVQEVEGLRERGAA